MRIILNGLKDFKIEPGFSPVNPPGDGFAVTDVLCCAICRTDAKMWDQGHRDLSLPRVLGHEMVVQTSDGSRHAVWPGKSCGHCAFCRSGRENLCEDMKITGFHTDGGFADKAILPEASLIPLPRALDNHTACFAEPVACVINAFEKLHLKKDHRILILGAGTMGLITALWARDNDLETVLIEKSEEKINHIEPFTRAAHISCMKETHQSEFDIIINTCADYIAFCQGITKIKKGGQISFFSGISKNEHIETNLINLIHYKEASVSGVYGMTRAHMQEAVSFMTRHKKELKLLIEGVHAPNEVPELMPRVLSGKELKHIIDFSLDAVPIPEKVTVAGNAPEIQPEKKSNRGLFNHIIQSIEPVDDVLSGPASAKLDDKAKPLGALGRLEEIAHRMSRIQQTLSPQIRQKNLFVFAADHGITEEGVSAYPSEVTAQMVYNFLNGGAAINVLCRHHGINLKIVDMGVNHDFQPHPHLLVRKVAQGTANFALGDAMTERQVYAAIENGMQTILEAWDKKPFEIVGLGEMGIGNTTSAAAMISVAAGLPPEQAAGRGTGVDDKGLDHKINVIKKALALHSPDPLDGLALLQKIGGFEIAGIAGAVLAAASKRCAVVLDGVISTAGGLTAYLINPAIQGYLISGHKSVEASQKSALSLMNLKPLIDFDMRLGEGTGAAIAISTAESACKIMCEMASFDEAKIARSTLSL